MAEHAEVKRSRELYLYFNPHSAFGYTKGTSLVATDPLLAAQAQLVCWRLNAKRCLINLLDAKKQYRVAEASKTSDFEDSGFANGTTDENIWMECRVGDNANSPCHSTIHAVPVIEGDLPFFEVLDFSKDPRFYDAFYVTGPPSFRYYCGVPLFSDKNLPIGAVCVLDDRPREALSSDDRAFLAAVSRNVMNHLQLKRDENRRRRAALMTDSLNTFVTADAHIKPSFENAAERSRSNSESTLFPSRDDEQRESCQVDCDGQHPFVCAAKLLCDSLDLGNRGSVLFLDTVNGSSEDNKYIADAPSAVLAISHSSISTARPSIQRAQSSSVPSDMFTPMAVEDLRRFTERYPNGKLWSLGPGGEIISEHSDENTFFDGVQTTTSPQTERSDIEVAVLLAFLPNAQSIMFQPFWNPRSSRYVAAFAYSTSPYRTFSSDADTPCLTAFCNCISIELTRMAMSSANKYKEDFIGSISHELRSPLHGILASCDFLRETQMSSMQASLLDTVNSCARTLLDTISMVLDYSKINSFENDWQSAIKRPKEGALKQDRAGTSTQVSLLPNLYGHVDLVAIVEEVTEGAVIGQTFQSVQHVANGDIGAQVLGISGTSNDASNAATCMSYDIDTGVEIIFDIAHEDWVYITQPGAFRRILMNLLGNALKYTKKGLIVVKLEVNKMPTRAIPEMEKGASSAPWHEIYLTVTDTGKGISQAYLQSHLFTPFSQEDPFSPGTGLGLSLVRSLLNMLDGHIAVESAVDVGTTVRVTIPMIHQSHLAAHSDSTTPSSGSIDAPTQLDNSAEVLRKAESRQIAFYSQQVKEITEDDSRSAKMQAMRESLQQCVSDWYGDEFFGEWVPSQQKLPSLLITSDHDLPALLLAIRDLNLTLVSTPILVLSSHANRQRISNQYDTQARNIEILCRPFGPYRLARAIRIGLEKPIFSPSASSAYLPKSTGVSSNGDNGQYSRDGDRYNTSIVAVHQQDLFLIRSGGIIGNEESSNARMALKDIRVPPLNLVTPCSDFKESSDFPFPGAAAPKIQDANGLTSYSRPCAAPSIGSQMAASPSIESPLPSDPNLALNATLKALSIKHRSPRVLVVDDNPINVKLLHTFMVQRKYETVVSASDGFQALRAFESALDSGNPIDIVFMDLNMPVMDGFESTRQIRQLELTRHEASHGSAKPPAMIIALTGLASERDQRLAFEAGVDLYMTKPARFREVKRVLTSWEAARSAVRQDLVPHGSIVGPETLAFQAKG